MAVRAKHHGNPNGVIEGTLAAGAAGTYAHRLIKKPQLVIASLLSEASGGGGGMGAPDVVLDLGIVKAADGTKLFPHGLGAEPVFVCLQQVDAVPVPQSTPDSWVRDATDATNIGVRCNSGSGINLIAACWLPAGGGGGAGVSGSLSWDRDASDDDYVVIRNGYAQAVDFLALCWLE